MSWCRHRRLLLHEVLGRDQAGVAGGNGGTGGVGVTGSTPAASSPGCMCALNSVHELVEVRAGAGRRRRPGAWRPRRAGSAAPRATTCVGALISTVPCWTLIVRGCRPSRREIEIVWRVVVERDHQALVAAQDLPRRHATVPLLVLRHLARRAHQPPRPDRPRDVAGLELDPDPGADRRDREEPRRRARRRGRRGAPSRSWTSCSTAGTSPGCAPGCWGRRCRRPCRGTCRRSGRRDARQRRERGADVSVVAMAGSLRVDLGAGLADGVAAAPRSAARSRPAASVWWTRVT